MASEIIAFVVDHWEDLLIAAAVGLAILGFDYFFLRKRRTDSKVSDALIETDRLIEFVLFVFIVGLYINAITGFLSGALIVVLFYLIDQRGNCIKKP